MVSHHRVPAVDEITRDQVLSFYEQRYAPGAVTVIITGDVTVEDAEALLDDSPTKRGHMVRTRLLCQLKTLAPPQNLNISPPPPDPNETDTDRWKKACEYNLLRGANAEYTASLIGQVPFFVEVNDRTPRTFGGNQLHVNDIVGWCENSTPMVEVPGPEVGADPFAPFG